MSTSLHWCHILRGFRYTKLSFVVWAFWKMPIQKIATRRGGRPKERLKRNFQTLRIIGPSKNEGCWLCKAGFFRISRNHQWLEIPWFLGHDILPLRKGRSRWYSFHLFITLSQFSRLECIVLDESVVIKTWSKKVTRAYKSIFFSKSREQIDQTTYNRIRQKHYILRTIWVLLCTFNPPPKKKILYFEMLGPFSSQGVAH